jgi:hypothetical protein
MVFIGGVVGGKFFVVVPCFPLVRNVGGKLLVSVSWSLVEMFVTTQF